MRLIGILLVLVVIGWMASKMLKGDANRNAKTQEQIQKAVGSDVKVPAVPTKPQDLKQFEKDVAKAMNDAAKAQEDKAEEAAAGTSNK
jgi:hypothetical protein